MSIVIRTRIGNWKMFLTVLWFCVTGLLLFCVNLEYPEHFAVLTKEWVSTKLGSIYIYLKILIGIGVWLPGVGLSFIWHLIPRWNPLDLLTSTGSA